MYTGLPFRSSTVTCEETETTDPNPWGGDNRPLSKLYASASNGECPIQVDTSTPTCGNSRFGCWTCTVVERDRASEGLLASGDERMEMLIEFRETLLFYRDPANGKRDTRRMNGNEGNGPLLISSRRELLAKLLALQEEIGLQLISPEELLLIQQMWKAARDPDDGRGVARIVNEQRAGSAQVRGFCVPVRFFIAYPHW